jgi:hypothetical protein
MERIRTLHSRPVIQSTATRSLRGTLFRAPGAMTQSSDQSQSEQPRGTLAIVAIYAALFIAGWLLIFLGVFLRRA